jgi:hypothetical protein
MPWKTGDLICETDIAGTLVFCFVKLARPFCLHILSVKVASFIANTPLDAIDGKVAATRHVFVTGRVPTDTVCWFGKEDLVDICPTQL